MAKRSLLLDFQHDGIDWILMRSGLRQATIEKTGYLDCPAHAADNPTTLAALRELRESLDIPGLACLAAIDGRGLMIRHITVPFGDKRKVRQILPMELEATLPMAADDLAVDFQLVGRDEGHTAVTVALSRAHIDGYVGLMRAAGLDPLLVTFSGLPEAVLLAAGPQGEPLSLLIDGDHRHLTLFCIAHRRIRFIRSWRCPAGEGNLSEMVNVAVAQTLEAAAQVLPGDIRLSAISLTPRTTRCLPPETLSTEERFAEVFDVGASVTTKLNGALSADLGQSALALGLYEPLSEKGLNLYRSTFPLKRFLQQHRNHIVRTGALAAVLTVLFMANIYFDIRQAERRSSLLEAQAAAVLKKAFPETRNVVDPLQQMIVKVRHLQAQDPTLSGGRQVAQIDILDLLSKALPKSLDIRVSHLVSGVERVQLSGTTGSFEAINEAKERLEKTDFFGGITIVSATMDQNAGRVRFKLAIDLIKHL